MDVVMPQLGETVIEGTITAWHKKVGESVAENEALFDVETDKVSTEIPAPASGVLSEILVNEGQLVKIGTKLATIKTVVSDAVAQEKATKKAVQTWPEVTAASVAAGAAADKMAAGDAKLSPVVRRLLAEHGLDPALIAGSGHGGRITRDDVIAYLEGGGKVPAKAATGGDQIVPLNKIRKRTGEHMLRSWTTSPHVLQAVEVNFSQVDKARRAKADQWKAREGFSLTYLPFIAAAVCQAVLKFPHVNASVDGDNLILHRRINLGIAVDLNLDGLIVPVVKDADKKSLSELAREMHGLAAKARADRLRPDDLTEGTYTLSNAGVYGTLITAPIINQPQAAILSVDGVRKKPVVIEGPEGDAIAIRPVGVLAQSFDHRAFDGAYSAAFLREVKQVLEQRDWLTELF